MRSTVASYTGASSRAAIAAHDQRSTRRGGRRRGARRGRRPASASSSASFARRSSTSPVSNDGEVPQPLRVLGLEPLGDLGEARVARDERRAAARGRLGGDHPERLREDRRHDRDVGERQQVDEVPVLERPGEERAPGPASASSSAR